jgi:hypothetical protein
MEGASHVCRIGIDQLSHWMEHFRLDQSSAGKGNPGSFLIMINSCRTYGARRLDAQDFQWSPCIRRAGSGQARGATVFRGWERPRELVFGSCSARLQAGMSSNPKCPPEGGRYKFTRNRGGHAQSDWGRCLTPCVRPLCRTYGAFNPNLPFTHRFALLPQNGIMAARWATLCRA